MKKGPLNKVEKSYIENNFDKMECEEIAKDLDRSLDVIVTYVDKFKTNRTKAGGQIAKNRQATAMTLGASSRYDGVKNRPPVRPKKSLDCILPTRRKNVD